MKESQTLKNRGFKLTKLNKKVILRAAATSERMRLKGPVKSLISPEH